MSPVIPNKKVDKFPVIERTVRQFQKRYGEHQHTGFDSQQIEYDDLANKKLYVHHTIVGTAAATAANYSVFYIVPDNCYVTEVQEVHQTAGTDGGAVTLNIEKLVDGEALGSGDEILESDFSLKATIDTVQTGTLTETLDDRTLNEGDRLAMKDTGTLTSVANVTVVVELTLF